MKNVRREVTEAIADFLEATDGQDYERQASDIVDMLADMGIGDQQLSLARYRGDQGRQS